MKNKTLIAGFACLALCLSAMTSKAQVELINMTNSVWTYLADGTDLSATGWADLDYTGDATWPTGTALFGVDSTAYPVPIVTPLTAQNAGGPTTDYFRHKFMWDGSVTDNPFIQARIHVDDGYVMYLNGVEIDRYNMPEGPVDATTGATTANPLGEPVTYNIALEVAALATPLIVGENVLAVELHQAGGNSSDKIWGIQADVVSGTAPVITSPTEDQIVNVIQGTSRSLTVEATGFPAPTFQWEFSNDGGATFNAITNNGTSATYTIGFMTTNEAGLYRSVASSSLGSDISPIFDVRLQVDVIPPVLLSACAINDGNSVEVVFNEDIVINGDPILYLIIDDFGNVRSATNLVVTGGTLLLEGLVDAFLGTNAPLVADIDYQLDFIMGDPPTVADLFGNALAPNTAADPIFGAPSYMAPVSPTVRFQEGVNGYTGTQDTEIRFSNPDANLGANPAINPDGADGGGAVHGLIRFDNLIGGDNGIPPGATIVSATLSFWTFDPGTPVDLHRMLVDWNEASTWNSLGDGVQADDAEAVATADAQIITTPAGQFHTVNVADSVQAWVDGTTPNFGWALLPTGGNGWDFDSSEAATESQRPSLTVCYAETPCVDVPDITLEPMSQTVDEGDSVTFSVIAVCGETYQWRKDGVDIPGAVSSSYMIPTTVAGDMGDYDVVVGNGFGTTTSATATLTVIVDTEPPVLTSTVADGTAGTVTLSFDEPLAVGPAQNTANYSIAIEGGGTLAVSGAVLQANGTDVVLTVAPSAADRYELTITGLMDIAGTPNTISPITVPLNFTYTLLDWGGTWSYTTNSADAPVPGWEATAFDDSAWLTGAGLFGLETSGGTPIPNPPGIQTPFTLTNELGEWQWAFYFRTTVNVPFTPAADVQFEFRHLIDDGAVFYVGGAESFRLNMSVTNSPAPVAYTNAADSAGEAELLTEIVSLSAGDNDIAVEVHQGNEGSSDVLFGLQIVAVTGVAADAVLSITQDGTSVTVTWDDPSLILLSAPVPEGPYTPVVGATSPYTLTKPLSPTMQYFALGEAP